jgi:hypothetical protein
MQILLSCVDCDENVSLKAEKVYAKTSILPVLGGTNILLSNDNCITSGYIWSNKSHKSRIMNHQILTLFKSHCCGLMCLISTKNYLLMK